MKKSIVSIFLAFIIIFSLAIYPVLEIYADEINNEYPTPNGYNDNDYQRMIEFFLIENEEGKTNAELLGIEDLKNITYGQWGNAGVQWEKKNYEFRVTKIDFQEKDILGNLILIDLSYLREILIKKTKINTFEVNNCERLKYINYETSPLSEIKIIECAILEEVTISDTPITELNIKNSPNLENLHLNKNKIKELELTNLKKLETVNVNDNGLEKLNLNGSTVRNLLVNNNNLNEDNLFIEDCPELTEFNFSNNNFINLDLSSNEKLVQIIGKHEDNKKKKIEKIDLNCSKTLEYLQLSNNSIEKIDLENYSSLNQIHMENNSLKTISLNCPDTLSRINLSNNFIEEIDFGGYKKLNLIIMDSNLLEKINLNGCTMLQGINLTDNLLEEINLENHKYLRQIFINKNFLLEINLEDLNLVKNSRGNILNISENLLIGLDLKLVENLDKIYSYNNFLLEAKVNENPNLQFFSYHNFIYKKSEDKEEYQYDLEYETKDIDSYTKRYTYNILNENAKVQGQVITPSLFKQIEKIYEFGGVVKNVKIVSISEDYRTMVMDVELDKSKSGKGFIDLAPIMDKEDGIKNKLYLELEHSLPVKEKPVDPGRPIDPSLPLKPSIPKDKEPQELKKPEIAKEEAHFSYLKGYSDNTIRPEDNITREEAATIIYRILDKDYRSTILSNTSSFKDVEKDRWSAEYIETIERAYIIEGYPDGTFRPAKNITRGEVATLVSRFEGETLDVNLELLDIKGHWAESNIIDGINKGWILGYKDNTFKPEQAITRAEFVTIVNRILEREVTIENMLKDRLEFKDLKEDKWYYEAIQEAINEHEYIIEDGVEKWIKIN